MISWILIEIVRLDFDARFPSCMKSNDINGLCNNVIQCTFHDILDAVALIINGSWILAFKA